MKTKFTLQFLTVLWLRAFIMPVKARVQIYNSPSTVTKNQFRALMKEAVQDSAISNMPAQLCL